jgi:type III secretion protein D
MARAGVTQTHALDTDIGVGAGVGTASGADAAGAGAARLELRVLRGSHAGARAPLPRSETASTVGATIEHDIVLRDSPRASGGASVACRDGAWTWTARRGAAPMALALGAAVRIGAAVITVDSVQAPWPDVDRLAVIEPEAPDAPGADTPAVSTDPPPESDDVMPTAELATAAAPEGAVAGSPPAAPAPPHPASGPRPHAAAKGSRRRWGIFAFIPVVAGVAGLIWASTAPAPAPAEPAAALVPAVPAATAETIQALIDELDLADSLKVRGRRADALEVVGVVDDDMQRDDLRERLSALKPAPLFGVLTRVEFKTEVDAEAKTLDPGLTLAVDGRAGLRVSGVVGEAREIEAVSRRIATELPAAVRMDTAIKSAADVVSDFSDELTRRGLAMHARLEEGKMIVDGTLARDRVAQWESLILDFNKRYGERIPFYARFDDDAQAATTGPPTPSLTSGAGWLPSIAAVVGGDSPYLVMADGRKVMLGGTLNGYELVEVRSDALVLKAAHGALREVAR